MPVRPDETTLSRREYGVGCCHAFRQGDGPRLRWCKRLLYAVDHAFPVCSDGYAKRTQAVAGALIASGHDVIVAARTGGRSDMAEGGSLEVGRTYMLKGVRYIQTRSLRPRLMRSEASFAEYVDTIKDLIRVFNPAAVMAASNWRNSFPAAVAAHESELPFFYEVRGFWEISRAARERAWEGSEGFTREIASDMEVIGMAHKVFTINRFMRDEIVRRGGAPNSIELVPNGFVRPEVAANPPVLLKTDLGIKSRWVVGYIGSFNEYEGLEDFIVAAAILREAGIDLTVLLVGSSTGARGIAPKTCAQSVGYRRLAERVGIAEHLVLPGRVAPEQVGSYYRLLDVVVVPRRPVAVSELVSPLKPLEAAAHGKRVLLSTVGPLADLSEICPSFRYFEKGSIESLAQALEAALREAELGISPEPCAKLNQYTWEQNVSPMVRALEEFRKGCRTRIVRSR